MTKSFLFSLVFFFQLILLSAQQPYFQQEVNSTIEVTLNDQEHRLTGTIDIEYINHSPDDLKLIYIHLWGNAFKSRKTAFTNQKIRQGDSRFYFADQKDLGGYSDLNFTVDDKTVTWTLEKDNPDIAVLQLNEPLKSGATIHVKTPLNLKIPGSFSRFGHVGESYQITQWYPKPAVYDRDGWHPMPYLDMGEFYSEFGKFDVQITLPQNYVVAATGILQTDSEKAFLEQKITSSNNTLSNLAENRPSIIGMEGDGFPASSTKMKTIRYTAEKVHDFAWFADKRYYVQKSKVTLQSGKTVDTWAFFTDTEIHLWKKAKDYLDRSVKFYSELVGEYPYPHATAVQSALSAGGGMEYPMITIIGLSRDAQGLDWVITHEVGHNWFYGILASNERDHAWMDEGLNSYYDHRYYEQFYEKHPLGILPSFLQGKSDMKLEELAYLYQARRNLDQAPEMHSDDFTEMNYYLGVYEKPAFVFKMLENYLGTQRFDEIMKAYYEKYKFKHPQPDDLRTSLEQASGKNLSWVFDDFLASNRKMDYALKSFRKSGKNIKIKVANKGAIKAPFVISGLKNGEIIQTQWVEGFENEKEISFPTGDYDQLVLDAENILLEVNRKNNILKTKGAFKTLEPLQLKFLAGIEDPARTSFYWLPLVGWNHYDEFMLGAALHNRTIPVKRFEFSLAPLYSFTTKDIVGLGNILYHWYPSSNTFQEITFDLGWKSFNQFYNENHNYHAQYKKLQPAITFNFRTKANAKKESYLNFRTLFLWDDVAQFSQDSINPGGFIGLESEQSTIFELSYVFNNQRAINPFQLKLAIEQQSYNVLEENRSYVKASIDFKSALTYQKDRNINVRFFAGGFLQNTERRAGNVANRLQRGSFALSSEGFNDYKYDYLHLARNETEGFFSRQIGLEQGGMKYAFGNSFRNLGYSNNYVLALNFKADLPQELPLNLPLKPYFDIGYFNDSRPIGSDNEILWSGGLMLDFFDGLFGLYFPIINSSNLKLQYKQLGDPDDSPFNRYLNRITFSLDIQRANPFRLIHRLEF